MFDQELAQSIEALASDLVFLDQESDSTQWKAFSLQADLLHQLFLAEEMVFAADAADCIAKIAAVMQTDPMADFEHAGKHLNECLWVLQTLAEREDVRAEAIKPKIVHAQMFLGDYSGAVEEEDTGPEIEEEFLVEIEHRIDQLEHLLFSVEPPEDEPETVRSVFREFHTLKGEAGIVGLKDLSTFYHQAESRIEDARHGKLTLTAEIISTLVELTQIGRMLLRRQSGPKTDADYIAAMHQQLGDAVEDAPVPGAASEPEKPVDIDDDFFKISDDELIGLEEDERQEDAFVAPAAIETSAEPSAGEVTEPLVFDDTDNESVEEETSPEQDEDTSDKSEKSTSKRKDTGVLLASQEADVPNQQLQSISLDVSKLDHLLNLIGDVASTSTHIAEHPDVRAVRELSSDLVDLARSCRALQSMASGLRMTPIRPLFQRVQRAAFEAARLSHKPLHVQVEGAETQIDRSLIDKLTAALVHMIRNAIDHGLESPEERRAAQKPAKGKILLRATRTDADIVIELSDDGRGLDLERIRNKAIDLGLIAPDAHPSQQELIDCIFTSGLSTARAVTGLSGRGVGMDAVRAAIQSVRGRVHVDTTPGTGTRVELRFPTALAAIEGLLVMAEDTTFILPISNVRESIRVTPEQISTVEGKGIVATIRGVVVPVLPLATTLGLTREAPSVEDSILVLIEEGDAICALQVDEVLESRQIIIRPMEGALSEITSLTGAALLNNRQVGLVLDIRYLVANSHVVARETMVQAGDRQVASERKIETVGIGANQVGMIDFVLRHDAPHGIQAHRFAINAFKVREFVQVTELTPMPHSPAGFAGMLMLRERTIPVVSLVTLLGFITDEQRNPDNEQIIVICEFSGQTVGFLASHVNRVSYISWDNILPPPETGGAFKAEYIVGSILTKCLRDDTDDEDANDEDIAFVLDFEQIVQNVLRLYGQMDEKLTNLQKRKEHNRVLLVEDSSLIRKQTAKTLEAAGIEVIQAENGQEAWDILLEMDKEAQESESTIFSKLDLVLSDIEMPRKDGYSLTLDLKKHPRLNLLPVVLHSSITNDTMITRAKEVHADGFVPKCNPEELANHLRRFL